MQTPDGTFYIHLHFQNNLWYMCLYRTQNPPNRLLWDNFEKVLVGTQSILWVCFFPPLMWVQISWGSCLNSDLNLTGSWWASNAACLSSFQTLPMLPVWGPHIGNRASRPAVSISYVSLNGLKKPPSFPGLPLVLSEVYIGFCHVYLYICSDIMGNTW